jgi:hypothetical protein
MSSSSRAVDLWVLFGTLFIAAVYKVVLISEGDRCSLSISYSLRMGAAAAGGLILAFMIVSGISRVSVAISERAIDPHRAEPAMNWLSRNTPKDSIVFHVNWSVFPELLFWNRHNRYINGLDPIFLYAYDPRLYWKGHYLETRSAINRTTGTPPEAEPALEDTYTVLTRDFGASYLFLIKIGTPELLHHALRDNRYRLRYDSDTTAIFEL